MSCSHAVRPAGNLSRPIRPHGSFLVTTARRLPGERLDEHHGLLTESHPQAKPSVTTAPAPPPRAFGFFRSTQYDPGLGDDQATQVTPTPPAKPFRQIYATQRPKPTTFFHTKLTSSGTGLFPPPGGRIAPHAMLFTSVGAECGTAQMQASLVRPLRRSGQSPNTPGLPARNGASA